MPFGVNDEVVGGGGFGKNDEVIGPGSIQKLNPTFGERLRAMIPAARAAVGTVLPFIAPGPSPGLLNAGFGPVFSQSPDTRTPEEKIQQEEYNRWAARHEARGGATERTLAPVPNLGTVPQFTAPQRDTSQPLPGIPAAVGVANVLGEQANVKNAALLGAAVLNPYLGLLIGGYYGGKTIAGLGKDIYEFGKFPVITQRPEEVEQTVAQKATEGLMGAGAIAGVAGELGRPRPVAPLPPESPALPRVAAPKQLGYPRVFGMGDEVIGPERQLQAPKESKQLVEGPITFRTGVDPTEIRQRLRTAIQIGNELLIGRRGETHADTLLRYGYKPEDYPHEFSGRGYVVVDDEGKPVTLPGKTKPWLDRFEGLKAGNFGEGDAFNKGLDSSQLPGFGEAKLLRESGMTEAEIEKELGGPKQKTLDERVYDELVTYDDLVHDPFSGYESNVDLIADAKQRLGKENFESSARAFMKAMGVEGSIHAGDVLNNFAELVIHNSPIVKEFLGGPKNAVRELRTDQISGEAPSGDLSKVGQEVREGTGAQGEIQEAPVSGQERLQRGTGASQGVVGFTQKGANIKQLIATYTGRGGKREAVLPGSIEKMHPDDLRQVYEQLESLHKERTKGGVATEKGQQALTQEGALWSEIRNRLFRVGLRQGENVANFSLDELRQVKDQLVKSLDEGNLQQATRTQFQDSLLKVNDLIQKAQPKGGKLYGGLPIFDPDLWGMSKEQVDAAKEKLGRVLASRGDRDAAKALSESSPNQFKGKSERAKAILNNPSAKPLHRQAELMNQPGEKLSLGDKARNLKNKVVEAARYTDKVISPPNVVFDMMDGGQGTYRGALMQNVKDVIDSDFNDETVLRKQIKDPLSELIVKNKMGKAQSERIGVYLNTLQEGGRGRMVQSGIDPRVINNIEKTITPAEREVAQAIRQMYDTTGPLIQKVAKDVDKVEVNLIPNYFSWQREWRKYKPDADELATNPNIPKSGATVDDVLWPGLPVELGSRVIPGSTISRVPKAKTPIKIDAFEIVDRYVRDAAHYISMRKNLKEISEIVRSDDFEKTYGKMGQEFTLDYLNTVARQGRYKRTAILDTLRRLTSRGVIAFRIPSQIVHLANIPLAQQRTGVVWWQKGLDEALSDEGVAFLRKNFAETFERGGGEPALQEVAEGRLGKRSAYQAVGKAGFWLQRRIDQMNAQATVLGLYMRRLKESGADPSAYNELPVNQKFLSEARTLAQRAVASPIYKDVPLVMSKGGSLARTFFQFQNTFLDQWSNVRYDLAQAGLSRALQGNPKLAMQMTAAIATMLLVETSIKYGYSQALGAATGQKPREDDTFMAKLWHETLRRVPGMGQLTSALVYGETGVPSIDVALQPIREGKKALKSEDEATRTISGTRAIGSAAEALGVPGTSQALDIVTGLERGKFYKSHEQKLKEQTGQAPSSMDLGQRFVSEFEYRSKQPRMSPAESAKAAERNIANEAKRGTELQAQLDKADRQWLQSRKLSLPGFDNKIKSGGTSVYLTEAETKRMSQLMLENYKAVIPILREQYDDLEEPEEKQALFSEATKAARQLARDQMLEEMSNSKNESNKKGKFQLFK